MRMFRNDYSEGAAPEILEALVSTNAEQHVGYTEGDPYCERARELIREACGRDDVDVEFCIGGTRFEIWPSMDCVMSIIAGFAPWENDTAAAGVSFRSAGVRNSPDGVGTASGPTSFTNPFLGTNFNGVSYGRLTFAVSPM